MPEDIITFENTGLNYDDDLLVFPKGDSRYRLNVIQTEDGNNHVLVNSLGRTLKTIVLPSPVTDIKIIGFVKDEENRIGIYALYAYYNAQKLHSFLEYSVDNDSVNYLLSGYSGIPSIGSILNFPDGYVDMQLIGNGEDLYLIWADGLNPPRMANVLMMRNYTFGSGSPAYSSITEQCISLYKRPFINGISATFSYDSSYKGNNVKNILFQFSIRKKYYDNTYTTISPFSSVAIPVDQEISSGRITEELKNNRITIQFFPDDDDFNIISYYQLLYRIVDIGDGSTGNWYIYENIEITSSSLKTIYFYNNKNIGIISSEEASRIFDYVPLKSNHIESIGSNRIVLDVGLEGFDNVDYNDSDQWDVSIYETTPTAISSSFNGLSYYEIKVLDTLGEVGTFTFSDVSGSDFSYNLFISTNDPIGNSYFVFESSYGFTNDDVFFYFLTQVTSKSYAELTVTHPTATTLTFTRDPVTLTYTYTIWMVILYTSRKFNTLKTGASYKFGIRYGFGGQIGFVQTNDDLILNTLNIGDIYSSVTYNSYYTQAKLEINHKAPVGATDYQIVCSGNNIEFFEDYICYVNGYDIYDDSPEYDLYLEGLRTIIRKNNIINRFRDAYKDGINYGFDFQEGDIVRFIGRDDWPNDTKLFSETKEFLILAVDSTNIYISPSAALYLDSLYSGDIFTHIQIIRKNNNFGFDNSIYQEFSDVFNIDADGYHTGNTNNGSGDIYQTASYPAIINITSNFSDSWKSVQVFINNENYSSYGFGNGTIYTTWMEIGRISLFYDSTISSFGRINTVNESSKQQSYNKIRFGGKFLDNSGINFISKFNYDDIRDLNDKYGLITKIHQFGSTLRIFQERKITSFYLGSITSIDENGNILASSSSNVPIDYNGRQFIENLGCTHFSSFASSVRSEYFYDLNNSCVIRASSNGIEIISSYKMNLFFESLTKRILQDAGLSNVRISGGFNNEHNMYMITFYDIRGTNDDDINYTLSFDEDKNRWISFFNYYPEFYGYVSGKYNLSFNSGMTYLDFSNTTRNSSIVRVHSNIEPNIIKLWDSISINSTNQWYPDENGDITISIPIEMKSRIKPGKFKLEEGEYRSEFLKDLLSGYSTYQENNLFNGNELRGYDIYIDLRYEGTDKAVLRLIKIKYSHSQ